MSYIGRGLQSGAFRQLDDISSGFDGSDTTHTMQVNSTNVTVGDVNQILLSLGGVIQKPGTDFTVSSSTLTFTTAPAANTSFFAILLGSDNGGTVTPTDSSVTTAKIVDANVTTAKIADANVTKAKLADSIDVFAGTSLSAADLGSGIHIKTADSGASVSSDADELILENSRAGMSFLSATDNYGIINFGDSGDNNIGQILYYHGDNSLSFVNNAQTGITLNTDGEVTKPLQPAFHVHPASEQADFNQGQTVGIVFGTERFDIGSNFASNTFTAPVTGKYHFDVSIRVKNMATEDSATYYYWILSTSNRSYYNLSSVNELGSGSASFTFSGSVLADMDASDTASVSIIMGGTSGSSPSDISVDSYWSGHLVC
jgi:hypothetical protein